MPSWTDRAAADLVAGDPVLALETGRASRASSVQRRGVGVEHRCDRAWAYDGQATTSRAWLVHQVSTGGVTPSPRRRTWSRWVGGLVGVGADGLPVVRVRHATRRFRRS